eukprot:Clim_evm3s170 gene=Clim_evmTU3s170
MSLSNTTYSLTIVNGLASTSVKPIWSTSDLPSQFKPTMDPTDVVAINPDNEQTYTMTSNPTQCYEWDQLQLEDENGAWIGYLQVNFFLLEYQCVAQVLGAVNMSEDTVIVFSYLENPRTNVVESVGICSVSDFENNGRTCGKLTNAAGYVLPSNGLPAAGDDLTLVIDNFLSTSVFAQFLGKSGALFNPPLGTRRRPTKIKNASTESFQLQNSCQNQTDTLLIDIDKETQFQFEVSFTSQDGHCMLEVLDGINNLSTENDIVWTGWMSPPNSAAKLELGFCSSKSFNGGCGSITEEQIVGFTGHYQFQ